MSIPEVFFRETIDLNRYSNAVSADFVKTYNDVILLAARKLNAINIRQAKAGEGVVIAPQTKKRLRAIIAQSKSSLDKWSKTTTKKMIKEIEGLAKVQAGFIESELKKAVKSGNIPINSVAVSSKYAESFVTTDPTKVNIFTSKQFTEDDFKKFGSGKFELTARQGAMQTLPNGETVEKAFRGIATRQQEGLARTIRQGVFSGESTQQIASRMIGRLEFGQRGSVRQIAQAGGEMTKLANHQIQTIVRTSVNQVQNQASQAVYAANSKVAPKYQYVATLDSRTSAVCRDLDGKTFAYNRGPTPPQHFNCRSTTVPVVDYAGLKKQKGFEDLTPPPKGKVVTRPTGEGTGRVPQDTQYGDWLLGQDKKLKVKTLGNEQKVRYFERLAKKEGSGQKAIRKMVREDGSERSLKDLERLYGKPSAIKPKPKPKPAPQVAPPKPKRASGSTAIATETLEKYLTDNNIARSVQEFVDDSLDGLEAVGGKVKAHTKKLKQFMTKSRLLNNLNLRGDKFDYEKAFQRIIIDNKAAFDASLKTTEKFVNKYTTNYQDIMCNIQIKNTVKNLSTKSLSNQDFKKSFSYYFRPAGGGNTGYTSIANTTVNTQVRQGATKITKTKAIKIQQKTNELLKQNKAYADYWKKGDYSAPTPAKEFFVTGQNVGDELEWITTMIHEIGHQVHFKGSGADVLGNKYRKLGGMKYVTGYSRKNPRELFAESFTCYVLDPDGLQEVAPRLYTWVEETLEAALKAL